MEKQKRWQFWLIVSVIVLTLYNILPTVFYYSKPLKSPIDAPRAENISKEIVDRVDSLEEQSREWLLAFNKLIDVKAQSIELKKDDPRLFAVTFSNAEDAQRFRKFLPQAGILIPFVPAQLQLLPEVGQAQDTVVYVSRNIGVHLDPVEIDKLFTSLPYVRR